MATRSASKRRRLNQDEDHRKDTIDDKSGHSIANLPTEVLVCIFELAATFDPPFTSFAISQACRQWRNCALDIPTLWSNTLNIASIGANRAKFSALLKTCSERSGGLTHVDVSKQAVRPQDLRTLLRSSETLVDLRIADQEMCNCKGQSARRDTKWHTRKNGCVPGMTRPGLDYRQLIHCVVGASNLERLILLLDSTWAGP